MQPHTEYPELSYQANPNASRQPPSPIPPCLVSRSYNHLQDHTESYDPKNMEGKDIPYIESPPACSCCVSADPNSCNPSPVLDGRSWLYRSRPDVLSLLIGLVYMVYNIPSSTRTFYFPIASG
ncbi:hypothetical protein DSO57_1006192 [Entomophthora muscae]|uniref:Uncharacterized protein n=1 Tax=Entomophthora muscae TaxID=34485 RepID=A0ACC2RMF9_9FUNG|nr:hypothetical protein DSO57_1006192 [Entomophthora muscae]